MPFIPPICLINSVLRKPDMPISVKNSHPKNEDINVNNKKQKAKKKYTLPTKCINCYFQRGIYCLTNNDKIESLDENIIQDCTVPEKLLQQRAKLKEAKWSTINKLLFKTILLNYDISFDTDLIYDNFDLACEKLQVWELLTTLHILRECFSNKDYQEADKSFIEYLKSIDHIDINSKHEVMEENEYDWGTVLLLKIYLETLNIREIEFFKEELTNLENIEDLSILIELLKEENLIPLEITNHKEFIKN